MPPAIQTIIESVDRAEVERAIDELRQQIEAYEELLAAVGRFGTGENGELVVSGGERAPASRKREVILAIMSKRPGHWTTRELRDALAARAINPQAGTPVKNVLWTLAKEGRVRAVGNGVYELSALTGSAEPDHEEARAA